MCIYPGYEIANTRGNCGNSASARYGNRVPRPVILPVCTKLLTQYSYTSRRVGLDPLVARPRVAAASGRRGTRVVRSC
jgi:hypothetical protein